MVKSLTHGDPVSAAEFLDSNHSISRTKRKCFKILTLYLGQRGSASRYLELKQTSELDNAIFTHTLIDL